MPATLKSAIVLPVTETCFAEPGGTSATMAALSNAIRILLLGVRGSGRCTALPSFVAASLLTQLALLYQKPLGDKTGAKAKPQTGPWRSALSQTLEYEEQGRRRHVAAFCENRPRRLRGSRRQLQCFFHGSQDPRT